MNIRQVAVSALSVGGLFLLLNACGPTTPVTPPPPPPPTACPATITANPSGFVYAPAGCTVTLGGSSKTVVIQASTTHPLDTVSSNWPAAISAAPTDQTITFTTAGTYTFKCHIHGTSGMTGTITVVN
jgi:plastocyanin